MLDTTLEVKMLSMESNGRLVDAIRRGEIRVVDFCGTADNRPLRTFEEVAEIIGVSRQRVEQIEKNALRKFRVAWELKFGEG